jgi:hypothetical protein
MGRSGMCAGEANYFIYYKRLGVIAKLATSYLINLFQERDILRGHTLHPSPKKPSMIRSTGTRLLYSIGEIHGIFWGTRA